MAVMALGSGIKRLTVGSRKVSTSSASMPRPATIRASSSGRPWRWTIDSARRVPRSSRRSRHTRPVADCSTPRKTRRVAGASMADQRHTTGPAGQGLARGYSHLRTQGELSPASLPAKAGNPILTRREKGLSRAPKIRCGVLDRPLARTMTAKQPAALPQLELAEFAVLGPDPAHRAGGRAHHHGLGLDHVLLEAHALQQRSGGDAGCREHAVALHHVADAVDLARILDAHLAGALALLLGVEHQAALHLSADAGERRGREHALRRAADAEIDVDAGRLRIGGMDHAGDVAVGDEAHPRPRLAHRGDEIGMARPVEDERHDLLRLDALGLGERADVVVRACVDIDHARWIAGADRDLLHVDV